MAKLAHQPFEDWLLAGDNLPPVEMQQLRAHLAECPLCSRLEEALSGVEHELRTAAALEPSPGFIFRWQDRLVNERLAHRRRQTLWILLFSLGGGGLLLALMTWFLIPVLRQPVPILLASAYELVQLYWLSAAVGSLLGTVLRTLVGLVPPLYWLGLFLLVLGGSLWWLLFVRRLTSSRRMFA